MLKPKTNFLLKAAFFETFSVFGYLACLVLIWICWPWSEIRARWYFSALIILFALRELDYDKAHFTVGLLKSRQYIGDLVAFPERVVSILILILVLTILISILVKETRSFWTGLFALRPSELAVMIGLVLIGVSKSVDGLGRKLAGFEIDLSKSVKQFVLRC